jgi:cyclic pyranopterin phosphate synthase
MPEKKKCTFSTDILTAGEIGQLASAFINLGINKIRLTGGEPLTRKDFPEIVNELGKFNVKKAITTNALLLDRYFALLKKNNFQLINISLDTLSPSKFKKITRVDNFDKVYRNLILSIDEMFEVKLNVVLIKDLNDNEIIHFARLTKDLPLTVRFIEFMPFKGNQWGYNKIIPHNEILSILSKHFNISPEDDFPSSDPAQYYTLKSHKGKIGIIGTVSKPFCENCNRIRITSDGKIKSCLFGHSEINLIDAIRSGKDMKKLIESSLREKSFRYKEGCTMNSVSTTKPKETERGMYSIGG